MELVFVCNDSDLVYLNQNRVLGCDNWLTIDYSQLSQTADVTELADLFVTFSPETFAAIVAATLVTFIVGHVTGMIVKLMNRT